MLIKKTCTFYQTSSSLFTTTSKDSIWEDQHSLRRSNLINLIFIFSITISLFTCSFSSFNLFFQILSLIFDWKRVFVVTLVLDIRVLMVVDMFCRFIYFSKDYSAVLLQGYYKTLFSVAVNSYTGINVCLSQKFYDKMLHTEASWLKIIFKIIIKIQLLFCYYFKYNF